MRCLCWLVNESLLVVLDDQGVEGMLDTLSLWACEREVLAVVDDQDDGDMLAAR